jgi:hypothetical protein
VSGPYRCLRATTLDHKMQERCIEVRDLGWGVGRTASCGRKMQRKTSFRLAATVGKEPVVEVALV